MRILRLTNSDDLQERIPEAERAATITARVLEARFGEPVEWKTRVLWPTAAIVDLAPRWVAEYKPDIVYVRLSSYWVTFESVPLRLRRKFGRVGDGVAGAGKATARMPWLADRAAYHALRGWLIQGIGGDTPFTTAEIVPRLEAVFRSILADESIGIVVRGPRTPFDTSGTKAGALRAARRMAELEAAASAVCDRMRITYARVGQGSAEEERQVVFGDRVHLNAVGQARASRDEIDLLSKLWTQMTGKVPLPAVP